MTATEKTTFLEIIDIFTEQYHYPVEVWGDMVHYQGKAAFNTEGYNFLYCLAKLTETLKKELV